MQNSDETIYIFKKIAKYGKIRYNTSHLIFESDLKKNVDSKNQVEKWERKNTLARLYSHS